MKKLLIVCLLFAGCGIVPSPPKDVKILPDTLTVTVTSRKDGKKLGWLRVVTTENGQSIDRTIAVDPDTVQVMKNRFIVDERYRLKLGRNEAEAMKLIGYEIDGNKDASGGEMVELDSDGHLGTSGEIEGYYSGIGVESGAINIAVRPMRPVVYTLMFNYKPVHVFGELQNKGLTILRYTGPIPSDVVISVHAESDKAQEAFIDFIELQSLDL